MSTWVSDEFADEVTRAAKTLGWSRSGLILIAVGDFIEQLRVEEEISHEKRLSIHLDDLERNLKRLRMFLEKPQ